MPSASARVASTPRLIHRARNVVAKGDQGEVKADFWTIFDDIAAQPGAAALSEASSRADAFATKWGRAYPGAVARVTEVLASLTTHLRLPHGSLGENSSH